MKQLLDPNFWFLPPPYLLTRADWVIGYLFVAVIGIAVILWFVARFSKHAVIQKLLRKIEYMYITIGLLALFWFVLRYENVPIFSTRYWLLLVLLVAAIWKGFVIKYLIVDFFREKQQYDHEQVKNKYIPGKR